MNWNDVPGDFSGAIKRVERKLNQVDLDLDPDDDVEAEFAETNHDLSEFVSEHLERTHGYGSVPEIPSTDNDFRKHPEKNDFVIPPEYEALRKAVKKLSKPEGDVTGGRIFFDCPDPSERYYIKLDEIMTLNPKAGEDKIFYNNQYTVVAPDANVIVLPSDEYAPHGEGLFDAKHAADVYIYGITFMNSTIVSDKLAKKAKGWDDMDEVERSDAVGKWSGAAFRQKRGPNNGARTIFYKCRFFNNRTISTETRGGGAVSVFNTDLEFWECSFVNNSGAAGGAIAGKNFKLYVYGCDFINNWSSGGSDGKTQQQVGNGGAIRADGIVDTLIVGSFFEKNWLKHIQKMRGAAMTLYGEDNPDGQIRVEHCRFFGNGGAGSGKAESIVNVEGSMGITMKACDFRDNRSGAEIPNNGVLVCRVNGDHNNFELSDLKFQGNVISSEGTTIRVRGGSKEPAMSNIEL